MKNSLLSLINVEVKGLLYGFKKTGGVSKSKSFTVVLYGLLVLMVMFYAGMYCYGLVMSGVGELILPYAFVMTSISVLFMTAFKSGNVLFSNSDYDLLMSFPIKTVNVIIAKLSSLYIVNTIIMLAIMIPALVVYLMFYSFSFMSLIAFIVTLLLAMCLPIIIGVFIGMIINFIASRLKYTNIIIVILSVVATVWIMALSFSVNEDTINNFGDISETMMSVINQFYPLAYTYKLAVVDGNFIQLIIFVLVNVTVASVFLYLMSKMYKGINMRLRSFTHSGKYKMTSLQRSPVLNTLVKKEFKRFLASPLYMMNTGIGLLMALGMSIYLVFFGKEALAEMLEIPGIETIIHLIMPLILAWLLSLCTTTSSSLSLEGKSLAFIKSMPISDKTIFDGKISMNLIMNVPVSIICSLIIGIGLKMDVLSLVIMIVFPLVYSVLFIVLGMYLNAIRPNYNWISETQVIKQSFATFIVIFGGMILAFALGILLLYLPINTFITFTIYIILMIIITFFIYDKLIKTKISIV